MSNESYQINELTREGDRDCSFHCFQCHGDRNERIDKIMSIINANQYLLSENIRGCSERMISIGATCIAEINGRFFLLVEIEIEVAGEEIEQVIIFRISAAQAAALLRVGVERCRIVTTIPTPGPGEEVNLICVFVVGNFAFLVFDVEDDNDELVLVRVPLCTTI